MKKEKTATKKVAKAKKEVKKEVAVVDTVEVVTGKINGMKEMLTKAVVTNDEELAGVSDKIKAVKMLKKFIEEQKDKLVAPAKAIIAEAREKYDPFIKECENAEITLKQRAGKFMDEVDAKRRADEAKLAARVEKGTMKPETAAAKIEAMPEVPKAVQTTSSTLRRQVRRVVQIVDPTLVPDEYWIIDEVRVRKEGLLKEIPGTIIKEETVLASM